MRKVVLFPLDQSTQMRLVFEGRSVSLLNPINQDKTGILELTDKPDSNFKMAFDIVQSLNSAGAMILRGTLMIRTFMEEDKTSSGIDPEEFDEEYYVIETVHEDPLNKGFVYKFAAERDEIDQIILNCEI